MAAYAINQALNGIEISFDKKPGEIIRGELKKAGYRWHNLKKVWYAKNTSDRLALAKRITNTEGVILSEGLAKEAAADLTVEKLNEIMEGYTFQRTGEGIYAGWTGCNANQYRDTDELKAAIIAELKKNGIKATGRKNRAGYLTSFTFTVTVPEQFQVSEEQYIERQMAAETISHRLWWKKPDGSDIFHEMLFGLPTEEVDEIRRATYQADYRSAERYGDDAIVDPEFVKTVKTIVDSFNSDHSNSMVDYFDRGIYDSYKWKF